MISQWSFDRSFVCDKCTSTFACDAVHCVVRGDRSASRDPPSFASSSATSDSRVCGLIRYPSASGAYSSMLNISEKPEVTERRVLRYFLERYRAGWCPGEFRCQQAGEIQIHATATATATSRRAIDTPTRPARCRESRKHTTRLRAIEIAFWSRAACRGLVTQDCVCVCSVRSFFRFLLCDHKAE